MTSPSTMLAEYRHSLLVEEQHAKSLIRDRDVNESYEGQVVNAQLEGVEWDEDCDGECDPRGCERCFEAAVNAADQAYDQMRDDEMEAYNR